MRMRDELEDLRRDFATEPAGQTRNLTGAVHRTRVVVPADPFEAERTFCST